jgi:hypothetical protein
LAGGESGEKMRSHTLEKVWTTNAGYKAVVLMFNRMGHRCGYVGVPPSHMLYKKEYSSYCPELASLVQYTKEGPVGKRGPILVFCMVGLGVEPRPDNIFDVHGGLAFSNGGDWGSNYPIPNTNLWWFGYNCGHCDDGLDYSVMPASVSRTLSVIAPRLGTIRTLEYCVAECESLAQQLDFVAIEYRKLLFRSYENGRVERGRQWE